MKYYITAGNNSTDLGIVGYTNSLEQAKRIGRKAVKTQLPNGEGNFRVRDSETKEELFREERSIRTDFKWVRYD